MPTLHLGVIDVPYVDAPSKRQKKTKASTVTTGDVARWLEDRYGVLEHFVTAHETDIAADLLDSVSGALETLLMGGRLGADAFAGASSAIEDRMKQFIAQGEMDALGVAGVPTMAAQLRAAGRRRSSRFKRRRGTNAKAVSFYDTGLYAASLKAWVDP